MSLVLFDAAGPGADFESLHLLQDRALGLRAALCIHSTRLGPAFGGIRRMSYPDEETALADARRLALGMTRKCALAGLPAGGAKMVLLDDPALDRPAVYGRIGAFVETLAGQYVCGPDVGTSDTDLDQVRGHTRWANPAGNDAAGSTARGVMAALRGVMRALEGGTDLHDASFVVQGLGSVGMRVAERLVGSGAQVTGSDTDRGRCEAARAAGVRIVLPEDLAETAADVFVPCALGGVVDLEVARRLPVRAVCGAANDQLTSEEAAWVLHGRDVLYAPDFAVNVGAVAEGVLTVREGATAAVRRRAARLIDRVEDTVVAVLERARAEDVPTPIVATRMAEERLGSAR